jgi:hypothetical protein
VLLNCFSLPTAQYLAILPFELIALRKDAMINIHSAKFGSLSHTVPIVVSALVALAVSVSLMSEVRAEDKNEKLPSVEQFCKGWESWDGFFPLYWDEAEGKLYVRIDRLGEEFLYVNALATGVGSNPLGLDRGRLGGKRVVHFERVGRRILLVQRNLDFRAPHGDAAEKQAVAESFAQSILWGGEIAAQSGDNFLVDMTGFVMSDAAGLIGRLDNREQGSYKLDEDRSAMYLPHTKAFPDNTEMEATLTFTGRDPGSLVSGVTPTPEALTVRQRHSFVRLPDANYEPRPMHPRCGMFFVDFSDYSAPLDQSIKQRWVMRHRLYKKNPDAAVSEAVEPIVYYVDRAIPEPIRSAVVEGVGWWAEAFEAAGFENAFRVEVAPEGMDLLDIHNNVVQWVHRSTRGWSYGGSVYDPRTGEIIKGHVSLGSLRVRQDYLLMEGLTPQYEMSSGEHQCAVGLGPTGLELAAFDPDIAPDEVALARIRQLACHEVGHTLGFAHNFAASSYGRASVMDYPAPLATITETGELDLSDAYDTGVGEWDKLVARYAYAQAEPDEEDSLLAAIVTEAIANKMLFISDSDSRSVGSGHPLSSMWDNGADPVAELDRVMAVRRIGLEQFSETSIRAGEPLSHLEDILVPLYLSHRYQLDAAVKSIGGYNYSYAMRGDGQSGPTPVPVAQQRAALAAMLRTIAPDELMLDEQILQLLPPQAFGYYDDRERFARRTGRLFDPLAVAELAARLTVSKLLHPQRAARMTNTTALDAGGLSLDELIDRLLDATWRAAVPDEDYPAAVYRTVDGVVLDELLNIAANQEASVLVRAIVSSKLSALAEQISAQLKSAPERERPSLVSARDRIYRFLKRPYPTAQDAPLLSSPPGSPIGNRNR